MTDKEKIEQELCLFREQERRQLETIKPLLFAEMSIPNYGPNDQWEYGSVARQQARYKMAQLIEEVTIDRRTYLIKRWRGQSDTIDCGMPRIVFREYALITLPDVRQVNKVGDVVLSDDFTRQAERMRGDAIVFVPLDFVPSWTLMEDPPMHHRVRLAQMERKSLRLPATDERLTVWECIAIEGQ